MNYIFLISIIFFYIFFYKLSNMICDYFTDKITLKDKVCDIIRDKNKEEHFYTTYIKMKELLNFFDISFVASGGTLIGAYRDHKFLPWDYDMDFCVNFSNDDKIKSKKFKKKATKLGLEFKYYKPKTSPWSGIGGLKICNKGKWKIGQIDIFYFSNLDNNNIYYLGNDGKPHGWPEHHYRKENLFPLVFYKFKFPTLNKTIEIPCPKNTNIELKRHFGENYYSNVPEEYKFWYKIDNFIYN